MSDEILDEFNNQTKQPIFDTATIIKILVIFTCAFVWSFILIDDASIPMPWYRKTLIFIMMLGAISFLGASFRIACWIVGGIPKLASGKRNVLSEIGIFDAIVATALLILAYIFITFLYY